MVVSISSSILRSVIISQPAPAPAVTLNSYGYFNVQNFQPEPGIYPGFATYDGTYPQSGFLNDGPNLQSGNPVDAVGSLTTNNWNGDSSVGGGAGASVNIQPMSVGTVRSTSVPSTPNIVAARFYFPMLSTDTVHLIAHTGSGDGGGGLYTAGTMTIVIGPSASAGERYLISWSAETSTAPPDATFSMERLSDIGPRP
jgi:hypothetical protein